jgi:hypothetical protein
MLPFLCLLLAACSSLEPAGGALSVQNGQPLYLSERADRSRTEPLGSSTVSGAVYIFATPPKTVREVLFDLDGQGVRRVRRAPYDLLGGTRMQAKALDTATLAEGEHTLRSKAPRRSAHAGAAHVYGRERCNRSR